MTSILSAPKQQQTVLYVGLTAVFIGYLTVWLPGPNAGLQFLGIEMGEWTKFLGVGASRNLFYLPPITLGLMLSLLTAGWPNHRWRTWLMRGLAVAVSLLAFPALEDVTGPFRGQYYPRLVLIGLVILAAGAMGGLVGSERLDRESVARYAAWGLLLLGIIGAILPGWVYEQVRPAAGQVMGISLGIGWGVWLNGVGHLLVAAASSWRLVRGKK